MSVFEDNYSSIAENVFFVLFVYLLVIGVWSAACNHDFISVKWKSVKITRRRGLTHFFVITFPMAYILAYICIQAKTGDFKEVGAAAVALCFAFLHLFRTFWGLWQLYEFKKWASKAIRSIQSLESNTSNRIKSAEKLADEILINDTIIDNRLMEGIVRCNFRLINRSQVTRISRYRQKYKQLLCYVRFVALGSLRMFKILLFVLTDKTNSKYISDDDPYIEPHEPEEIWLRWASVLVSDAIPEWLPTVTRSYTEPESTPRFDFLRDKFAEEILLSSSIHVQHTSECNSEALHHHSFLNYQEMHQYESLKNGLFSKYEFLRKTITSGHGLPFSAPHHMAYDEDSNKYCYCKFKPKLKRIIDSLPADRHENAKELGIKEIEWLAVFLSISQWNVECSDDLDSKEDAEYDLDETQFPVINLAIQLGYIEKEGSQRVVDLFSLPLLRHSKRSFLWGNRNILECSLHVDNWIALKSGSHIEDMTTNSKKDSKFRWDTEANMNLEYDRNRYQQLFMAPHDHHFEQTLTFLGCSMEGLRSILAKWTLKNEKSQSNQWVTKLNKTNSFSIPLSEDLNDCIKSLLSEADMRSMYFKMRLLWELQSYFRSELISSKLGPSSIHAVLLCMLSFPAISMRIDKEIMSSSDSVMIRIDSSDQGMSEFKAENHKISISAVGLPENFKLEVVIFRMYLNVRIVCCDSYKYFGWADWRNSFMGRLSGLRKWQWENWCWTNIESLKTSNDSLTRSMSKIDTADNLLRCRFPIESGMVRIKLLTAGTGECLIVWKGWLPHRRHLCHFELESEGLIKIRKQLGYEFKKVEINGKVMPISVPEVQYLTGKYDKCDRESLQRTTVISAAAIVDLANEKGLKDSSSCSLGESLRKMADKLRKAEAYNYSVAITMYETAAVYCCDFSSLECALVLLYENTKYDQAATLIELFFYSNFSGKKFPTRSISSENIQNCDIFCKLRMLFEECVEKSDYSSAIAERYAQFCLILSNSGENCVDNAKRTLQRVLLRASGTSFTNEILQCIKLYCYLLISTEDVEDLNLEEMIVSKIRRFAESLSGTKTDSDKGSMLMPMLLHLERRFERNEQKDGKNEEEKHDLEYSLGRFFDEKANRSPPDVQLAAKLYKKAADVNHLEASYNYAILLKRKDLQGITRNPSEAMKYYLQAANGGQFRAAFNLARLLQKGDDGVEANPSESAKYFKQAVDAGYMKAAHNYANLLRKGADGVPQNVGESIRLFREASDSGRLKSTFALVDLFLGDNDGADIRLDSAFSLLEKAFNSIAERYGDCDSIKRELEKASEMLETNSSQEDSKQILRDIREVLTNMYKEASDKAVIE